jgi:hypothetical protein
MQRSLGPRLCYHASDTGIFGDFGERTRVPSSSIESCNDEMDGGNCTTGLSHSVRSGMDGGETEERIENEKEARRA